MTWILEEAKSQQQLADDFIEHVKKDNALPLVGAHDGMSSLLAKKMDLTTCTFQEVRCQQVWESPILDF